MSFIPIVKYGIGLGALGLVYYIMNSILDAFIGLGTHETGTAFNLMTAFWTAVLLIYIIFGGWWVIRTYNEENYMRGRL